MERLYTAFETKINGKTFYIVKNYRSFPEYLDVQPVLEKYGMHVNFYQACKIAMIYDKEIQQQILTELQQKLNGSYALRHNSIKPKYEHGSITYS